MNSATASRMQNIATGTGPPRPSAYPSGGPANPLSIGCPVCLICSPPWQLDQTDINPESGNLESTPWKIRSLILKLFVVCTVQRCPYAPGLVRQPDIVTFVIGGLAAGSGWF